MGLVNYGAPHCDLAKLKAQVANVVRCDKAIEQLWKSRQGLPGYFLEIPVAKGYTIQWKTDASTFVTSAGKIFYNQSHM